MIDGVFILYCLECADVEPDYTAEDNDLWYEVTVQQYEDGYYDENE